jgi:hypothetical protein
MRTAFRTSKAERSAEHACKCSSALSRGKQDWMTGAIGTVVRLKPLASGRLNWSTCQRPQRRAPEFGLWLRCFRHGAHRATLLCLARGERSLRSALCVHGSPRCAALHLCGLGGCHTNDHLARRRSRCQSRGDVDNITKRREIADGCAKPGRANEGLAGVNSRSYRNGHRGPSAGRCRLPGQINCAASATAVWWGPLPICGRCPWWPVPSGRASIGTFSAPPTTTRSTM